ncbi:oligosaccharide flippase family protein [Verrucomicrobiota bacterium]
MSSDRHRAEILLGAGTRSVARGGGHLLSFAFYLLVTRLYGPGPAGIYVLSLTVWRIASLFALLGTQESTVRFVAAGAGEDGRMDVAGIRRRILLLVVPASLIVSAVLWLLAPVLAGRVFGETALTTPFRLTAAAAPFAGAMAVNAACFRGLKKIAAYTLVQSILPSAIGLALLVPLALWGPRTDSAPVLAYSAAMVTAGVLSFLLWHVLSRPRGGAPADTPSVSTVLRVSTPMLVTAGMHFVLNWTDAFMLGLFRTSEDVGIYRAAFRIASLVTFAMEAVRSIAGPKIAQLYWQGRSDELRRAVQFSSRVVFAVALPCFLAILACPSLLMRMFGGVFAAGWPCLVLLACGQFVSASCGLVGIFLQMAGEQKALRNITVCGAGANLLLNLLLIPLYGITGAAAATAFSTALWNIMAARYARKKFGFTVGMIGVAGAGGRG